MRAVTVKRLAILIAVFSLVGGTGFFAHGFQLDRNAQSRLKQAELAEKAGDFAEAEKLYGEFLAVFPANVDVRIKYANALLKVDKSPRRQNEAIQIYAEIVKQGSLKQTQREDARRRLMQLKIDSLQFKSGPRGDDGADVDLDILLNTSPDDGKLLFLRGRCYEAAGTEKDYEKAEQKYEQAIQHKADQWIEAYQRRAILLRDHLNRPEDAKQAIETMVQSAPENAQVYLARGRYHLSHPDPDQSRRKSLLEVARSDFEQARQRAPANPEIYLEKARTFEDDTPGRDEARQTLEQGLEKAPKSTELYQTLATLELRDGHVETAIKTLENGLKSVSEPGYLRFMLAEQLARRGDTGKLRLQIEELKRIGFAPIFVEYLTALYYFKTEDFFKARQSLLSLQGRRGLRPEFKAQLNVLLAQCYGQLGEPEMQRQAYLQALNANPEDLTAKRALIENLVNQGAIEEAIKEYQALVKRAPQVRLPLAQLLIARNQRRPESQREWSEVKRLIDDAKEAAPESVEPVILEVELLLTQDKADEARNVLEKASSRFPKSVAPWTAQATLLARQGRVDEALSLLDQAKEQLGDRVELRLRRAQLWAIKGGPQVGTVLNDLAQNIESFSREDCRKLLGGLADISRQQDPAGASGLLSQLAEEDPNNLNIRLTLFDLAIQTASKDDIEKNIKEIERIEGSEGLQGRFAQVRFWIWQADQGSDKKEQEELRTKARVLLTALRSRRADSPVIPLLLAELEEQELRQGGLKEDERWAKEKEESIINSYLQAIKLGRLAPAVMRRAVQLLFKNDRGSEALEILNNIPVESQLAGDLGRQAELFAIDKKDFPQAEQIARKAVDANPGDFQERFRLVQILLNSGRQADAEVELRQAVDLSKSDPDRWVTLVGFMVFTKQAEKAEQAIRDAEKNLPQSKVPLALADCCAQVGRAYNTGNTDDAKQKKWYAEAKKWYEKAQADRPDDLSIKRRLTKFFLDTKQMTEAKSQLDAILKQGAGTKTKGTDDWARRTLASVLATDADPQEVRKALSLFELTGQPAAPGQEGKTLTDPEDLRILARVLDLQARVPDVQRIPQYRARAIEILKSLTAQNLANSDDDRFLLARLYELSDDWPKAREEYQELNLRTRNIRNMETLNRRPLYLDQFAKSLLRHRRPGEEQDLANAQELVDELKQLQPNALGTLILEVEIEQARDHLDRAEDLIRAFAARPNPTSQVLESLVTLAEKLGRFKLAEELYRQYEKQSGTLRAKMLLAKFLGRRDRAKDALNICEPLWANPGEIEEVVKVCLELLLLTGGTNKPDPAQLNRVSGWLDRALKQPQNDRSKTLLLYGLGTLREQQERYQEAEALYETAVKPGDGGDGTINSKLIADAYNNLAWLMALYDRKGREALEHINHAIELEGQKPDYLDTRGVVYLTAADSQHAIDDLEKAVKVAPSPSKYFHLAQAYLAAKNKEKAKQAWQGAKIKSFEQSGLHALEKEAYQNVLTKLGAS